MSISIVLLFLLVIWVNLKFYRSESLNFTEKVLSAWLVIIWWALIIIQHTKACLVYHLLFPVFDYLKNRRCLPDFLHSVSKFNVQITTFPTWTLIQIVQKNSTEICKFFRQIEQNKSFGLWYPSYPVYSSPKILILLLAENSTKTMNRMRKKTHICDFSDSNFWIERNMNEVYKSCALQQKKIENECTN